MRKARGVIAPLLFLWAGIPEAASQPSELTPPDSLELQVEILEKERSSLVVAREGLLNDMPVYHDSLHGYYVIPMDRNVNIVVARIITGEWTVEEAAERMRRFRAQQRELTASIESDLEQLDGTIFQLRNQIARRNRAFEDAISSDADNPGALDPEAEYRIWYLSAQRPEFYVSASNCGQWNGAAVGKGSEIGRLLAEVRAADAEQSTRPEVLEFQARGTQFVVLPVDEPGPPTIVCQPHP